MPYPTNMLIVYLRYTGHPCSLPAKNPTRKVGYIVPIGLYSALDGKYTLGQIMKSCASMAEAALW